MNILTWATHLLEYLGGSRDESPANLRLLSSPVFWGVWWGMLAIVIYIFCGQSSKFIYIDF
jgi:hypothetical protein